MEKHSVDEELLLKQVFDLVMKQRLLSGRTSGQYEDKVAHFVHPLQLKELVDVSLADGRPRNHAEVLSLCEQAVNYSIRTGHPMFLNQLYHGADPVGLAGAWLSESLNTNAYSFEVAPFFLLVEDAVLKHMRRFIGWEEGDGSDGDGIFTPGGSISNMYGMILARYKKFPQVKQKGSTNLQLVAFTSQEGHYSISKAANWMGVGMNNVIAVTSDESGRMIPSELEREIHKSLESGQSPFFVNATAGTTVLGAYDPLESIADICAKHGIWLHVDAAWGGGALVSSKHRGLMKGIERADSVAWNAHKMLGAPLTCSAFLVKYKGLLHECNSVSASYLFQQDKFYDVSYDTGDKSIQCGRKVDAFKLWLMWKARGDQGLERIVDNAFDCARYFFAKISNIPEFRPVLPDVSCTNVCFWYIPPRLQCRSDIESAEWWAEVSKVAPEIKRRMMENGSLMISYQPLPHKGWVNFFRFVLPGQPAPSYHDMDVVIDMIQRLGRDV